MNTLFTSLILLASSAFAAEGFYVPSQDQFSKAVQCWEENGKRAAAPNVEVYKNFVKFASGTMLPVEQAMFLTHIVYGTMGLEHMEEIVCKGVNETTDKCPHGKYHGRGYIMLSTEENYKKCSKDLYDDEKVLLEKPELLLKEQDGLRSALWYWFKEVRPSIMAKEALTKSAFGVTINSVNGENECPREGKEPKNKEGAKKRLALFQCVKKELGVPGPDGTLEGCL